MTVDDLVQLVEGLVGGLGDVSALRFGPPEPVDIGKELSNDEWVILVRFLAGDRPTSSEDLWRRPPATPAGSGSMPSPLPTPISTTTGTALDDVEDLAPWMRSQEQQEALLEEQRRRIANESPAQKADLGEGVTLGL